MKRIGVEKDIMSLPESQRNVEKSKISMPKISKPDKLLKVTVGLEPHQVTYLDQILYNMKRSNPVEAFHVKRSEIVRAIINGLERSNIDLNLKTPEEIEALIFEKLK